MLCGRFGNYGDNEQSLQSRRRMTGCVLSSGHQYRIGFVSDAPTAGFTYVSRRKGPPQAHEGDGRSAGVGFGQLQ